MVAPAAAPVAAAPPPAAARRRCPGRSTACPSTPCPRRKGPPWSCRRRSSTGCGIPATSSRLPGGGAHRAARGRAPGRRGGGRDCAARRGDAAAPGGLGRHPGPGRGGAAAACDLDRRGPGTPSCWSGAGCCCCSRPRTWPRCWAGSGWWPGCPWPGGPSATGPGAGAGAAPLGWHLLASPPAVRTLPARRTERAGPAGGRSPRRSGRRCRARRQLCWAERRFEQRRRAGRSGGVPKWPKGADCKSAGLCLRRFESFPHHAPRLRVDAESSGGGAFAGVAQLVEH